MGDMNNIIPTFQRKGDALELRLFPRRGDVALYNGPSCRQLFPQADSVTLHVAFPGSVHEDGLIQPPTGQEGHGFVEKLRQVPGVEPAQLQGDSGDTNFL